MSEIKTKIRTYNDVIDLFGEEKAADMLSEALDWSTIDPKNDKKNIMERKPLLLDPYMTYEGEDYCKHIVAGFLGDRILDRIADEIVGYNVAFDIGFLKAAGATINPDAAIIDTMQEFMDAFGNSNMGHRYQPLSMAAERLGYNWTSAPHDSLSDTLACLAAQKCVDDHNWCVENLELTEDAIMHAKPIENGSEGLPKDCWDLNPGGRPFAVTEPILHRLQSSAKLCARAGTTTQFTRMTVNQWFDKAERSQRSPLGRSVDIGRAASALNSQHEHAEVPQDLTK